MCLQRAPDPRQFCCQSEQGIIIKDVTDLYHVKWRWKGYHFARFPPQPPRSATLGCLCFLCSSSVFSFQRELFSVFGLGGVRGVRDERARQSYQQQPHSQIPSPSCLERPPWMYHLLNLICQLTEYASRHISLMEREASYSQVFRIQPVKEEQHWPG